MNVAYQAAPTIAHFELEPENNFFRSLVVDLTHRCNMRCSNCYIPNRDIPDMDVEKLYDVLARLPFRTYVRLLGAEPTLRSDLPDIIKTIIELGHKPSLTTNGLKLAHLDYCDELKAAGLKMVLISMNGADDDAAYDILDGGHYATLKKRALVNALRCGFLINTGTIIAKGINEHVIDRQIELIETCALQNNVRFDRDAPWRRLTVMARFKSIGRLGRHMDQDHEIGFDELVHLIGNRLGLDPDLPIGRMAQNGLNVIKDVAIENASIVIPFITHAGPIYIRIINWAVDAAGVVDPGNWNRGRITKNWKIAPFFEDVKLNEYGY